MIRYTIDYLQQTGPADTLLTGTRHLEAGSQQRFKCCFVSLNMDHRVGINQGYLESVIRFMC